MYTEKLNKLSPLKSRLKISKQAVSMRIERTNTIISFDIHLSYALTFMETTKHNSGH